MATIATFNAPPNAYGNSNLSDGGVALNSSAQPPSYSGDPSIHSMPREFRDERPYSPSRDTPFSSPSSQTATPDEHALWCPICKDHTGCSSIDSLKRHARDHLRYYYCPYCIQDLQVSTEHGPKCPKCDKHSPDPKHLNKHQVPKCVQKLYTRKENLDKHLTKLHNDKCSIDASATIDQKHFACGFCGHYCKSSNELVDHIHDDARHHGSPKNRRDWNNDMVIWGLLSPNVRWRDWLAAHRYPPRSSFSWSASHAEELIPKLEMGQEPADSLCQAAISKRNHHVSSCGYVESAPVTGYTDTGINSSHSFQAFHDQDRLSPLASTPDQRSISSPPPARDWNGPGYSDCNTNYRDWQSPQMTREIYGTPMYGYPGHRAGSYSSQNSGEDFIPPRCPPYVPSETSTRFSSHTVAAHFSPPETSSYHSIDTDLDFNNQPRTMQDPNCSRQQGRYL